MRRSVHNCAAAVNAIGALRPLGYTPTMDRLPSTAMSPPARVQVLISEAEAERFEAYCRVKGFKKSTLIARLIREHLDRENFETQLEPFQQSVRRVGRS